MDTVPEIGTLKQYKGGVFRVMALVLDAVPEPWILIEASMEPGTLHRMVMLLSEWNDPEW